MNNNFTKSDLKDGMVVTFRNGEEHYVIGNGTHIQDLDDIADYNIKYDYEINLTHIGLDLNLDIMKVSYMGEVLWERKEYVSFDQARKSGKRIRYCGELNRVSGISNWSTFSDVLSRVSDWSSPNEINEVLDNPMWEIEE